MINENHSINEKRDFMN